MDEAPRIPCDLEVCPSNVVMVTDRDKISSLSDDSMNKRGNFVKRKLSYNARSDTVLEMCNTDDISFIDDDDPCEFEIEERQESSSSENEDVLPHASENNTQQIVIKINSEVELTSIVVKSTNQDDGKLPISCGPSNEYFSDPQERISFVTPLVEKSEKVPLASVSEISVCKSDTSRNSDRNISVHSPAQQSARHRFAHSLISRRNVLVRQEKLDCDFHPSVTRKRHSFVPENQLRNKQYWRARRTASL